MKIQDVPLLQDVNLNQQFDNEIRHSRFQDLNGEMSSGERLRKAIERNRAKQARKTGMNQGPPSAPEFSRMPPRQGFASFDQKQQQSVAGRRSVGRPDQVEFVPGVKRSAGLLTARTTSGRSSSKKLSPFAKNMIKLGWGFCFFLVVRLIFSNGGVVDYYRQNQTLEAKLSQEQLVVDEISDLEAEIEMIKSDHAYQKKLIRDELGFIAQDEFLILFQSEKSEKSI